MITCFLIQNFIYHLCDDDDGSCPTLKFRKKGVDARGNRYSWSDFYKGHCEHSTPNARTGLDEETDEPDQFEGYCCKCALFYEKKRKIF